MSSCRTSALGPCTCTGGCFFVRRIKLSNQRHMHTHTHTLEVQYAPQYSGRCDLIKVSFEHYSISDCDSGEADQRKKAV